MAGVLVAVGAVATGVFLLVRGGIVDDAYITLSYARNLAFHLHWGLTPEHTSNTATSPLNVLVQGLLTAILRRPVVALGVLFVLSHLTAAWALVRTAGALRVPAWTALLGALLVLFNPLLDSAVGLEIALSGAVLALLLMAAVEARPILFGVFSGLLVLTRPDLVVIALVVFLGHGPLRRSWAKVLGGGLAVSLPWFVWSWVVLGSAVPDTMLIKAVLGGQQAPGTFAKGPWGLYAGFPGIAVLAFVPALAGVVALVVLLARGMRPRAFVPAVLLGIGGVVHYAMYSLLNAPLFHWYYSWTIITLTYLLALSAGLLRPAPRVAGIFALSVLAIGQAGYDVHHGVPWTQAAYNGNAALPAQYAAVGRDLPALIGNRAVRSPGEVGTIAYFCQCEVLDELSDRGIAMSILREREAHLGTVKRTLYDLNFLFLDKTIAATPVDFAIVYRKAPPASEPYWPATGPSWIGNGYDVLVPVPR